MITFIYEYSLAITLMYRNAEVRVLSYVEVLLLGMIEIYHLLRIISMEY